MNSDEIVRLAVFMLSRSVFVSLIFVVGIILNEILS